MPTAESRGHWERLYSTRPLVELSWHQPEPALSLELVASVAPPGGSVLDVGGGSSYLVDRLVAQGFQAGVLDVAGAALEASMLRLGDAADDVEWFVEDVTRFTSPHPWDVWHDRAVFHFLTESRDRAAYAAVASASVRPGGWLVIAPFAETGPERCSGLPTMRYSSERLARELGSGFLLVRERTETHETPSGGRQDFLYCVFRKSAW